MTSRATPKAGAKAGPKGSVLWMSGLASGALLTFAAPTALLLGVLLAPAIACVAGEQEPSRSTARAVALCCAAAALRPLWRLWLAGDQMDTALGEASDVQVLLVAWGAGACAWALCQVVPVVLRITWEAQAAARAHAMQAELARTREEWDLPS